jgi:hypothetical protein
MAEGQTILFDGNDVECVPTGQLGAAPRMTDIDVQSQMIDDMARAVAVGTNGAGRSRRCL